MASDDGGGLHDFVAGRYAELRRSAFLMGGDWALADELTQKSLARLVAENRRTAVDDPDAFVYSHLMASFQHRRARSRQHLFVAAPRVPPEAAANTAPSPATGVASPPPLLVTSAPPKAARHRSRGGSMAVTRQVRKIAEIRTDGEAPGLGVESEAQAAPGAEGDGGTPEIAVAGMPGVGPGDPIRTILVLDALHKLAPRCRAVVVLRHWDGFAVDEAADMLGLADERVDAYEAAGLAALGYLLADREPAR